jgi:hypothetical protein
MPGPSNQLTCEALVAISDDRHGTGQTARCTLVLMEAAVWSAIAIVAAVSTGTLFLLVTRIDALSARIDGLSSRLDARLDGVSSRIDALASEVSVRFDGQAARIDAVASDMTARFERVDARFERLDGRLAGVERDLHQHVSRDVS